MKNILIINGPNLNMLGKRDHHHYGKLTLEYINFLIKKRAKDLKLKVSFFQSNHEGKLIDWIQKKADQANAIIINPGALTHYSYALRDALSDTKLPIVEVHLSDVENREPFRKVDVLDGIVVKKIAGFKEKGYLMAIEFLHEYFN